MNAAFFEMCEIIAQQKKKIEMLEDECRALREQLQESDPDTAGYGIKAIKPGVSLVTKPKIQEAPFPPDSFTKEEAKMAVIKAKKKKDLPKLWYMRDNHTFRSLPYDVEEALDILAEEFEDGSTYGMLCARGGDDEKIEVVHARGKDKCVEFYRQARNWMKKRVKEYNEHT